MSFCPNSARSFNFVPSSRLRYFPRDLSENRMRLGLEIVDITRANWPKAKPLFIRISASDWYPEGEKNDQGEYISWGLEQSKVSSEGLLRQTWSLGEILTGASQLVESDFPQRSRKAWCGPPRCLVGRTHAKAKD